MSLLAGGTSYNSDRTSDEYICVNSCGRHQLADKDLPMHRPDGRSDFQLIYLWKGAGRFLLDGQDVRLQEGALVLYKPWQEQRYTFLAEAQTIVYWLHFTGRGVPELLRTTHLWGESACQVGKLGEIPQMMERIMREQRRKGTQFELFCGAYCMDLLASIGRRLWEQQNAAMDRRFEPIVQAIERMHEDYFKKTSLDDYAQACNMSLYHFVHQFKAYTGIPPHAYQTQIRIEKAKDLIANSTLNMTEIAAAVGYDNPLYFSRVFKQHTGFSPTLLRKCL